MLPDCVITPNENGKRKGAQLAHAGVKGGLRGQIILHRERVTVYSQPLYNKLWLCKELVHQLKISCVQQHEIEQKHRHPVNLQ